MEAVGDDIMHLGQTAKFLAEVFKLPEATPQMVGRIMRENGLVAKGARGRNAPHLTDVELARFIIALMVSEGPASSVERLRFFGQLPLADSLINGVPKYDGPPPPVTFEGAFAKLLENVRENSWEAGCEKSWQVDIDISYANAAILTPLRPDLGVPSENHSFHQFETELDDDSVESPFPYLTGLERTVRIGFHTLFRISRADKSEAELLEEIGIRDLEGQDDAR
ncbi:hypothetical protein [uncultured Pseudosulfitobacter sp.]|uniref:hypothetical protein n=1 Tax=uncultured Pseudosulfitobacter sp. TaxID=2854214 RepID=UPI0030DC5189|tara:strand:- start:382 stop:1053 length:672 start_codon:yes stop_codon:yes gene_type:complete